MIDNCLQTKFQYFEANFMFVQIESLTHFPNLRFTWILFGTQTAHGSRIEIFDKFNVKKDPIHA